MNLSKLLMLISKRKHGANRKRKLERKLRENVKRPNVLPEPRATITTAATALLTLDRVHQIAIAPDVEKDHRIRNGQGHILRNQRRENEKIMIWTKNENETVGDGKVITIVNAEVLNGEDKRLYY